MTGYPGRRRTVLVVLAAAGLAGCDSAPDAGPARTETPSGEPGPGLQRPAELPLDGVDPCALLGTADLDALGVNSRPRRSGAACSFDVDRTEPYYSYVLETMLDTGLGSWAEQARQAPALRTRPNSVAGFPALTRYRASRQPSDCQTLVGVATGQTLRAQLYPLSGRAFGQQQLCDMSERAATLAVRTLRAGK
ncbi:DUF3558 domain-containing protein [Amycolatopsis aidingensis]|uniref:DUF3558 domain-containing protein n=1 Tax=Amycolatopsis aidingensis TaxID=2842453 RepID=UPI001E434FE8|nr:DUF3558 domain-containing protein [Amycolatopsis aidingensis]